MGVAIWTDGSCLMNPGGAGGWAFVAPQQDYEESGS